MTHEQIAELAARLHDFGKAYPVEIFPEITDEERAEHSRLITRAAAQMGRHFAKFAVPAADLIESMAQRVPVDLHPRTADLVDRFALALKQKLAAAEKKYGYSDGWADDDWMDECRGQLLSHVEKGDPRDVAAYCAFLWHHGESTAPPARDRQEDAA